MQKNTGDKIGYFIIHESSIFNHKVIKFLESCLAPYNSQMFTPLIRQKIRQKLIHFPNEIYVLFLD